MDQALLVEVIKYITAYSDSLHAERVSLLKTENMGGVQLIRERIKQVEYVLEQLKALK